MPNYVPLQPLSDPANRETQHAASLHWGLWDVLVCRDGACPVSRVGVPRMTDAPQGRKNLGGGNAPDKAIPQKPPPRRGIRVGFLCPCGAFFFMLSRITGALPPPKFFRPCGALPAGRRRSTRPHYGPPASRRHKPKPRL